MTGSGGLGAALVDLVLPRRCVGCGAAGVGLCADCRPGSAPFPVAVADGEPRVVAAGRYGNELRRAIIAYKERDRRDLAGVLGALLGRALWALLDQLPAAPAQRVVLIAPPSARGVAAARGGDHVLRLARAAVRPRRGPPGIAPGIVVAPRIASGIVVMPGIVRATRRVRDSAGLGVAERERNLAGSMTAAGPGRGADVAAVVVDDIVTTGATLRETTRALRVAGWPVLGCAVVAATPRRLTAAPLAGHGRAV